MTTRPVPSQMPSPFPFSRNLRNSCKMHIGMLAPNGGKSVGNIAPKVFSLNVALNLSAWHALPCDSRDLAARDRRLINIYIFHSQLSSKCPALSGQDTLWVHRGGWGKFVGQAWRGCRLGCVFKSVAALGCVVKM